MTYVKDYKAPGLKTIVTIATVSSVLLTVIVLLVLALVPIKTSVHRTLDGIMWNEETKEYETVSIYIDGDYHKYLFNNDYNYYQGLFEISSLERTLENHSAHILFTHKTDSDFQTGSIQFASFNDFSGKVYCDSDFDTIYIDYTLNKNSDNEEHSSISFPAQNMDEAKRIKDGIGNIVFK